MARFEFFCLDFASKRSHAAGGNVEVPLKEILISADGHLFSRREGGWPMPLAQPSRNDRQAVLAEVERLLDEYLDARNEFERVLQMALEGNQPSEAVDTLNALIDGFHARKLTLDRYVAAAAEGVRPCLG